MIEVDAITQQWALNESDRLAVELGYRFSPDHGQRVCDFLEKFCRLSQGRWANQPMKLIPWQRQFVMRLYGWRAPDGRRRFRKAFLLAAKKNGKSPLMSGLGLNQLLMDGEAAAEVYICASDRDQSGIIYEEASRMVQFSPALQRKVDCIPSRKTLVSGHGKLIACSSDAPKLDGLNASTVLFDEVHRQSDRLLWDVMEYSTTAREQPLILAITTAGESHEGIWDELLTYAQQVESGVIQDPTFLGMIFAAAEEDDLDDPRTWRRANPSLGVTFSEEDFRRDLEEAKTSPAKLANFKRLRLNIVCRSEDKFVDLTSWDACAGEWFSDPYSAPAVYLGLDLSSNDDITALIAIWGDFISGFDVGCRFWLPKDGITELEHRHGQPYREWAREGLISLTEGNVIDDEVIERDVVEFAERVQVKSLFIDPWNARRIGPALMGRHGLPVENLRQGWASLTTPTKTLGDLINGGKLRHAGNRILRWHASNCVVKLDAAGNVKLDKSKRKHKIDGMAALVNAIAAAIAHGDEEASVYETPGNLAL